MVYTIEFIRRIINDIKSKNEEELKDYSFVDYNKSKIVFDIRYSNKDSLLYGIFNYPNQLRCSFKT